MLLNVESIFYRKAQKLTPESDAQGSKSESKEVDFAYYFHIYIRETLRSILIIVSLCLKSVSFSVKELIN